MAEVLPIIIQINNDLKANFPKLSSVVNKLEAQFNFHALAANWYGDEDKILMIQLSLETPVSFALYEKTLNDSVHEGVNIRHFSDDVIYTSKKAEQWVLCNIAITETELELLGQQPKVLAGFLQAKLNKVLNLIAIEQSLASI